MNPDHQARQCQARSHRMVIGPFTSTVPWPHFALHWPPLKLIQFRLPHGPSPTDKIGFSWTQIRKSNSKLGVGNLTSDATRLRGSAALDCDAIASESFGQTASTVAFQRRRREELVVCTYLGSVSRDDICFQTIVWGTKAPIFCRDDCRGYKTSVLYRPLTRPCLSAHDVCRKSYTLFYYN